VLSRCGCACQSGSPFSYKDFKELWKEMRFSYIHHAKPKDMEYSEYMQRLYSSTLGTTACPSLTRECWHERPF
jgi:hypothetical protein